jgi:hypothetical protein
MGTEREECDLVSARDLAVSTHHRQAPLRECHPSGRKEGRSPSSFIIFPKNGGQGVEFGHSPGRWKVWRACEMASEPLTSPHRNGIFANAGCSAAASAHGLGP